MDPALAELGATANSYQVLAKLAVGGMAEIFLARSIGVGAVQRYVVLKRVLREHARDLTFVRMFVEEARLAAQLQHANIAQVYDAGKLGDSYFFTMEYVHGETVRAMLSRAHELRRSPPLECVLAIAAGAAAGLQHAHERIGIEGRPLNIVHRDVSPSNLMIGYDGIVKVVDFGVAKTTERVETQTGGVKGKISYLSPEQARGMKLDRRSDVFSLGIVMWEMLAVERLYKRDSDYDAMTAIIHEPPPPPSSRRRDCPRALDEIVLRALAKHPDDRFQTAEELGHAIERVAAQLGATLAPSSLSRFLKDLFGTRPEPWIELRAAETAPDAVTVTSEPIPPELAIPPGDPIDRRLAGVKDLSVPAPPGPFTHELDVPEPVTVTPTPSTTDKDHPTAPRRFDATAPAPPARTFTQPAHARRLPVALIAAAAAGGVALAIAIPIATREDRNQQRAAADATALATTDASAPVIVAIENPPDAAAVIEPAIVPGEPPDPAEPTDGGEPPDPAKPPVVRKKPPPKKPRTADVKQLVDDRAYAKAVAECRDVASHDRAVCAQAACLAGNAALAKAWFDTVSDATRRERVIRTCKRVGIVVCTDAFRCMN